MLDLLLVHPGAAHGIYGKLGDDLVAVEPPLWCRLIAGYVRDRGFTVRILDCEAVGYNERDVARIVDREGARLVVIAAFGHQPSASTQQMTAAGAIAREIKNRIHRPQAVMMVGGHVSALPARTMDEEQIDFACVGEGPITIAALLAHEGMLKDEDKALIPGLVWWDRYRSKIHINRAAPLIENLAELHGDTWDLLPMAAYRAHNWQCFGGLDKRQPYASIYTSLGCPYKCSFCCINAPFQSNRYRMRDPDDVVAEVKKLWETFGITTFKIVDEMFVLNEAHYTGIAEGLARLPFASKLNIWAYARVDTVKPNTLALLRRAGIRWLALGIESGSKFVRDGAQKNLKNDDIAKIVRSIQAAGINVIGNYIFGLPDDDMPSMAETLALAESLNTEFANFYSAMAYPGSKLYDEALAHKSPLPASWRGYSQHNDDCRPLDTKHITGAEVLAFRDVAFSHYFSRPEYLEMVGKKFDAATVKHVRQMTTYKLNRKLLQAAE